ncbi:MAG: type I restriction endonuclease subunit R [Akkermansiaceae bacterium]|jgi:type I restriction enzyme R subunit
MPQRITESAVEEFCLEVLETQGYRFVSPERLNRLDPQQVIIEETLRDMIAALNPQLPQQAQDTAVRMVMTLSSQNLLENNEEFHRYLTEGIKVEIQRDGESRGEIVNLVDFDNPRNNRIEVTNQFTVSASQRGTMVTKRPDVVILINGIPLVVIELKNPSDEHATLRKAYDQLQTYKQEIPQLFYYNAVLIATDGIEAQAGSLTAGFSRFMRWKTVDGLREDDRFIPQLETLSKGMLRPDVLLDLIKQFTVYEKSESEDENGLKQIQTVKKIAAYHQYHAVNKAVESTIRATSEVKNVKEDPATYGNLPSVRDQPVGDQKAGVVWHTQGSGKSLSMVFYTGKIVLALNNPTVVVLTDRNDLDQQLFDTFASCKQLLRQTPVQAEDRDHLKTLLKTEGGGIIFTTIQKFAPEEGSSVYETLSERRNIVVMADEAHRSQYGFAGKTIEKGDQALIKYGFAKYLRDGLPKASFIGFTGTPIERDDASTPAVFGNYIDVYDIEQAVKDGATVKIFYESRLAKLNIDEDKISDLDDEFDELTEGQEDGANQKTKAKWTQLEAIVGHPSRVAAVAEDFIQHFETRQEAFEGKVMFVAMSRRIAVEMYEAIVKLRPEWHDDDLRKGKIKVVMTSTSSDPTKWVRHATNKQDRQNLAERLKNPSDELEIVIVRDMWLTGFDAPSLHTLYIDKPMKGHNLMQAIARVNRVYKDKEGGLIVDYLGIATSLKEALATYTESGGKGKPTFDQSEAIALMCEKLEVVIQLLHGYDFKEYFEADTRRKMIMLVETQDFILGIDNGKERFCKEVNALSKAFALAVPSEEAMEAKDEVAFFQAVKARLAKFDDEGGGSSGRSSTEIESAVRQLIDKAVISEGVIDIFDAAGIQKPDVSILSDDFMDEVRGMDQKNLAVELLRKLLNDEIKSRTKRNAMQSKKLSEMLANAIRKYQNNLLTAAQVIEELIKMSKEIKASDKEAEEVGLSDYEYAFYMALADNDSAKDVMDNDTLKDLAIVLVNLIRKNATIDWTKREKVRIKMRALVKTTLKRFGYPPDLEKLATENILKQAELLADDFAIE